uniref:Transmembrane protein n=1 Tax=Chloropicon primus TaxID=1764295 RepID=A0A7S2X0Z4_9CHLO
MSLSLAFAFDAAFLILIPLTTEFLLSLMPLLLFLLTTKAPNLFLRSVCFFLFSAFSLRSSASFFSLSALKACWLRRVLSLFFFDIGSTPRLASSLHSPHLVPLPLFLFAASASLQTPADRGCVCVCVWRRG